MAECQPDCIQISIYKKAKHHVTKVVLKANKLYYNSKIASDNCSKAFYKITNNILARTKQVHRPTMYPLSSLPELFSNYFSDKILTIRNELDSQTVSALPAKTDSPLHFCWKYLTVFCPHSLHWSIRLSVLAYFPKFSKVLSSFLFSKKPSLDSNELNTFRPISNLLFISKFIEKLVLVQISHHLSAKNLLNQFHSAYRPGHSTETALLKIVNDLLLSLDDGNIYLLASLDLSAAFDTIDHNILLHRLQHDFGLSGTVLDWF